MAPVGQRNKIGLLHSKHVIRQSSAQTYLVAHMHRVPFKQGPFTHDILEACTGTYKSNSFYVLVNLVAKETVIQRNSLWLNKRRCNLTKSTVTISPPNTSPTLPTPWNPPPDFVLRVLTHYKVLKVSCVRHYMVESRGLNGPKTTMAAAATIITHDSSTVSSSSSCFFLWFLAMVLRTSL